MTFTLRLSDGTDVLVDGTLDPSLPVVVLLHGLSGTSADMTAPGSAYPGLAFNRTASFPALRDEGFHGSLPLFPVARFFLDPVATTLTSWSAALKAAGFTVITYTQTAPSGLLAPNVTQLTRVVTEALMTDSRLMPLRVAFVGHSRGGVLARALLVSARTNAALSGFLPRVTSVITVHSPNAGSSLATLATTVDSLLASVQAAFTGLSLAAPPIVGVIRTLTGTPGFAELVPGSTVLTAIAAGEPVPGVTYHTFGGNSTESLRLWADVFTPDSAIPLPAPFPLFHWDSTPMVLGRPLNAASLVAAAALSTLPSVVTLVTALNAFTLLASECRTGAGDLLVTDASARLSFAASHSTNAVNHLEALSDRTLQAQVAAILFAQRSPTVSGMAAAKLSPYPAARGQSRQYHVVASDAVTGVSLTPGVVTIRDGAGHVALTIPAGGAAFTYKFLSTTVSTIDPDTGKPVKTAVWPTVTVDLGPPYGSIDVDAGLP